MINASYYAGNQLYEKMWLYYNLSRPVMRLAEKAITPVAEGQPTRIKRRFDRARTSFVRLCETRAITQGHREELEALRERTNPRQLRQEIYELIDYIFSSPGAVPGKTEDVYQTIGLPSSLQIGVYSPVTLSFEGTIAFR